MPERGCFVPPVCVRRQFGWLGIAAVWFHTARFGTVFDWILESGYGRIGSDLTNGQIAIVIRIGSYGIFSTLLAFIAGIRIVVEDLKLLVYASETSFDHRTPEHAPDAAAPAFVRRQSRAVATINHPGPMPIR
jgi:hypothetical protein